jgi:type I restriction enzyme M protein
MASASPELISMADIARLAGQSRATVGNWKSREADFPPMHSRGNRGPLYDRESVLSWLMERGRLADQHVEQTDVLRVADLLRSHLTLDQSLTVLIVLLALRKSCASEAWDARVRIGNAGQSDERIRTVVHDWLPFAQTVLPHESMPAPGLEEMIELVSNVEESQIAEVGDNALEALFDPRRQSVGEFTTPDGLRALMVELAGSGKSVYDPCCGTGRLLLDVIRHQSGGQGRVCGQELNEWAWALCQLNLNLHGVEALIGRGDVLVEDLFPDEQFDRVVANPPFGMRLPETAALADDPRWIWGEPGAGDANLAWVQHCLYHVSDHGRAVIALPPRVLFEKGRAARTMQGVIKAGLLDAVVALPPGLLAYTSIPCVVLVLVKGRRTVKGRPAPTLMVDLSDVELQGNRKKKSLDPELIRSVSDLYSSWRSGFPPEFELASSAEYEDLAVNDFDLSPKRYVVPPGEAVDSFELGQLYEVLTGDLVTAVATSTAADAHLIDLLRSSK